VDNFDFIIVGSGAGGSTVSYRLGELSDAKVLILEAGGRDLPEEAVEVPYRWNELLLTELDWAYNSVPQPGLNNRQIYSAAGKAIGGGSVLYHMMHVRARPADLDNWAYNGCPGWSFQDTLPFYQKMENQLDDTNPTAGKGGPITVANAKDTGNPTSQDFIDACVELGYPLVEDFNASHFGVGWHHVNVSNGKRAGVLTSYLMPALNRGNVTLRTGALATKLMLENNRCVGVEYIADGQRHTARADREVIVCCGAIQSPKLLMLSGIGNPAHLKQWGIPVTVDLPGVGENFHDHPLVIGPVGKMADPGADPRGNMTEVGLFWGSTSGMLVPDLEICLVHRAPFGEAFFTNVVKRLQTSQPIKPVQQLVDPTLILSLPGLVAPRSRGWVRLRSSDPTISPDINANYGAEPTDIDRIVTMVKIAREIYDTKTFTKTGLREISPGPAVKDDAQLREWVIDNTGSYYHFVGSCKMGVDRLAVVDPQLKVHGVDGLRVADGSIIPTIPAANTHTTIAMIGERAAEFIKTENAHRAAQVHMMTDGTQG
jgi:choline dehydrogenase